ncbi:hypothetical protein FMLHJGGC_00124 [Staphylococcus phage BSwM-KMM1]|nr:hypothetical protein FMLHJGGC_00124 [Pseudomonas phage BSwM KMM1]
MKKINSVIKGEGKKYKQRMLGRLVIMSETIIHL